MIAEPEATVEIRIPSDPDFVRVVRLAVSGVASRMAFNYDEIEDIKLAVSEACNNAIQHACASNSNAHVVVRCITSADSLTILVKDNGAGIRDTARPLGELPEEGEESGLGFFLMKALMDEVECESSTEGTKVRLVKKVKR